MQRSAYRSVFSRSASMILAVPLARFLAIVAVAVLATLAMAPVADAGTADQSLFGCPRLSEGDHSECVGWLQWDLNRINPGYSLDEDQEFGPETRIAVLDFQGTHHLGADGIVGSATGAALTMALSDPVQPPAPVPTICRALPDDLQGACIMAAWCSSQDLGYERGYCVPLDEGETVGGGKSPLECAADLAGGQVNEKVTKDAAAEAMASEAATLAAKRLSAGVTITETSKCLFWDVPEE